MFESDEKYRYSSSQQRNLSRIMQESYGNPRTSHRMGYVSKIRYTLKAGLTMRDALRIALQTSQEDGKSGEFPGNGRRPFGG